MSNPGISDIQALSIYNKRYSDYYNKSSFGTSNVPINQMLLITTPYDKDIIKLVNNRTSSIESSRNVTRDMKEMYRILYHDVRYNEFTKTFFSKENVKNVQKLIIYNVFLNSDYIIDTQDLHTILLYMRNYYLKHMGIPPKEEFKYKIDFLNKEVAKEAVPKIINTIRGHFNFLISRETNAQKVTDTMVMTSTSNTKSLNINMLDRYF